MLRQE
jgi:RNA recognition motif-containing protein